MLYRLVIWLWVLYLETESSAQIPLSIQDHSNVKIKKKSVHMLIHMLNDTGYLSAGAFLKCLQRFVAEIFALQSRYYL
uniref:Secreted protein n=1 Tax=Heterorhabditis bacteriophora TaxID=37862 RepID=A0A1I7WFY5_HETBA